MRGRKPTKAINSALVHIRQHGIRTTKSEERRLGEEPAHLRVGVLPAKAGNDGRKWNCPQQEANDDNFGKRADIELGVGRRWCVVINDGFTKRCYGRAMTTTCFKCVGAHPSTKVAHQCGDQNDEWKWRIQGEDGYKRGACNSP